MSETLARVKALVSLGEVRASSHGYDELEADGVLFDDVLVSLQGATVIEDYPNAFKGPSVLTMHQDAAGQPFHVLWGIPSGQATPAVMITMYRPDPNLWTSNGMRRRGK